MVEDRVPEELEFHLSDSEEEEQEPVEELILTPSAEEEEPVEELTLTPSAEEEEPENGELILEAERIAKDSEITFDGEDESEDRIRKAMEDYDAAMDNAAGLKQN